MEFFTILTLIVAFLGYLVNELSTREDLGQGDEERDEDFLKKGHPFLVP